MPKIIGAPGSRVINFRLTPQEYDQLLVACSLRGMRCLSEFPPAAVFEHARSTAALASTLHDHPTTLDRKLSRLDSTVDHIVDVLATSDPSDPAKPKGKKR